MDFFLSSVLSGILWDTIKASGKVVTGKYIKSEIERQWLDDYTCELIADRVNSISSRKEDFETFKEKFINDEEINTILKNKLGYRTEFAKRLNYIIDSINQYRYSDEKINIEYIGEFLGFSSVNELKCYYISDTEPTYLFMDDIAKNIGVNKDWLKFGKGKPFSSQLHRPSFHRAIDYLKQIINIQPREVIFVLSDDHYSYLGIVLGTNELKYEYFPEYYHFSNDVGGEGQSQIFSIYNLIKELNTNKLIDNCIVRTVSKEDFEKVFTGAIYTGAVCQGKRLPGYWFYDFLDLYQSKEKKEMYINSYGEAFVECQNIVKAIKSKL
ncbi:MAG: hypothetical protein PHG06_06845 [Parabacteroides sp.]|nr:hypothetical protein [Tissierellia bacterium]MDD4590137.1 hypothetical protein [Parabacteroides sp.]